MRYSRKFSGSGSIRYLLACAAFGVAACSEQATGPAPHVSRQLRPQLQAANLTTITFVSDPTWSGQNVCLNAFSPLVCPAGATVYGYPGSGWATDLSTISGARWLWMSGVTGSSASYPALASFSKSFSAAGTPISGSISIGADDFAELIVNGTTVGAIGSTTNSTAASLASSTLQTFDITTYLIAGTNIITVRGANGNFGCGAAEYRCNPAGVVFGGTLQFAVDLAPVITMPLAYSGVEGEQIDFNGITVADAEGDPLSYTLTFGDGSIPVALPASISGSLSATDAAGGVSLGVSNPSYKYGDNGTYTITLNVAETGKTPALGATAQATITVANATPVVSRLTLPASPVAAGTQILVSGEFSDTGWRDTHTALFQWDWDAAAGTSVGATLGCPTPIGAPVACSVNAQTFSAGSNAVSSGSVSAANTYMSAGVYTVRLAVTDDDSGAGSRISSNDITGYVVVYDPSSGFVTGGGWIDSPAGACSTSSCAPDGSTVGKANFGFVSRYQKGATIPSGNTQFHFNAGSLKFESTSYQWLVIAGARAQYKGEGTINNSGHYGFLLTAIDGDVNGGGGVDKFRIKVWDIDQPLSGGSFGIVYDNKRGSLDDSDAATGIGGGSIVIKSK